MAPIGIDFISRCQDQLARFTMREADFLYYEIIMREFLESQISYDDFHGLMEFLLSSTPRYRSLRLCFAARHRRVIMLPEKVDDRLFRWTATNFVLYYTFLHSAHSQGTMWDHPRNSSVEAFRNLVAQWDREWNRLQDREFSACGLKRPGPPFDDPHPEDLNPEDYYEDFLAWESALIERKRRMAPEEYHLHDKITKDFVRGEIKYDQFEEEMKALLDASRD